MNAQEKLLAKTQLEKEQQVLKDLKAVYRKALKDVQANIAGLNARTDMQNIQSIIYQKKYQEALEQQIKDILDDLNNNSFESIDQYIRESYDNGYIGQMWKMQKETGVTMVMPIDQKKVMRAYTNDTKLSSKHYKENPVQGRLAENVSLLKKRVRSNVSRGIAAGMTWTEVAYNIASGMKNSFDKAMNDAMRIARTEGHRVNQQGYLDAGEIAKNAGADCVKQWDSTLDGLTRPWHREADGQIRELDDDFIVDGEKMQAPSVGGSARNVCNCRCQTLIRARWALDEDELKTLQDRAAFFGLDKTDSFNEFKEKYLKLPENADTLEIGKVLNEPVETEEKHYKNLLAKLAIKMIDYRPVQNHTSQVTEEQIISNLGGGDRTSGSCASLGLAYIGQKLGWNILDFRGGDSQRFFSTATNLYTLSEAKGVKTLNADGKSSITVGNRLLKQVEAGKEYYLCVGRHAAIVRRTKEGVLQYLELQSAFRNGWTNFNGNPKNTLHDRFGCTQSLPAFGDFMIDLEESDFSTDEFKSLLGYINTAENEQKKGSNGTIK